MRKYIVTLKWKLTIVSEKYTPVVGENHGYISPEHPSESSLSIEILNVMANFKRQYSTLYQLKTTIQVNNGHISRICWNITVSPNP